MNIKKHLRVIRKKLFTTYEYDKSSLLTSMIQIDEMKSKLLGMKSKLLGMKSELRGVKPELLDMKFELLDIKSELLDVKSEIKNQNINIEKLIQLSINNHRVSNSTFRYIKKKNEKICVLFLVNNLNAWYAIDELVRTLTLQYEFEVIVASLNKRFPGQDDYTGEEDVHLFLEEKNIKHIRLGMQDSYQALDIIMSISPDVIFRQSQWDPDYPPALSSENLHFTKLAIISYEICNIVKNTKYIDGIKDSATDSLFHRRCWRVYCATDYVKENAVNNGSLGGKQFKVVGHPKIDYLLNVVPHWPFEYKGKCKILWSPHHSIGRGWSDFGMFHGIWKDMIILAHEMDYIDFVFCPHPALVTLLKGNHSPMAKEDYEEFLFTWNNMKNCHQYYGADYAEIAAASDLIITDGISMLMECQLLNKEIIFMERDGHVPFNNIGNILSSGYHVTSSVDGVQNLILDYMSDNLNSLVNHQKSNIKELFPNRMAIINIIDDLRESFLSNE
ncbi:hypothetical protein RHO14_04660 [Orbus wheelerorum]|uniref:hypothetical protein n=1 Tax=Orbus wheelerorum TaxID=3074111 RepID=UPI00370DDF8F